ncbi:MAG: FixH family protein [Planctomycetota bacterium]
MTTAPHTTTKRNRFTVIIWPGLVFFFMGVSLTAVTLTVVFATSDGGAVTEEAYYAKAVAWDDIARERAASEALGWTPVLEFDEAEGDRRRMFLTLTGSDGAAVPATEASVFAFHHADRRNPVEFVLTGSGAGVLKANAPMPRPGIWEVRLRVRHHGDVFVYRADLELQ